MRFGRAGEDIRPGDIVLLWTGWADAAMGTPDYFRSSPGLTADAAEWLRGARAALRRLRLLRGAGGARAGLEAPEFVVHRTILRAGVPLVEGLVGLGALPPRCEFFALLQVRGIEAAPARAFAMVPA